MIPKLMHQTARSKSLTIEDRRVAAPAARLLPGWQSNLWDDRDNSA